MSAFSYGSEHWKPCAKCGTLRRPGTLGAGDGRCADDADWCAVQAHAKRVEARQPAPNHGDVAEQADS